MKPAALAEKARVAQDPFGLARADTRKMNIGFPIWLQHSKKHLPNAGLAQQNSWVIFFDLPSIYINFLFTLRSISYQ